MRQVIALELVGLKKLDCDLYDEKGKIIYKKGTEFTPEILMKLNHIKIFKRDEEFLTLAPSNNQISKKKNLQTPDEKQEDQPKKRRDNFNELHEKEVIDSKRKDFNELHEKEITDPKRKDFNELHEKEITDPKRKDFNELHEKEITDPKRKNFNELHEKEITDPKRKNFNELYEKQLKQQKKFFEETEAEESKEKNIDITAIPEGKRRTEQSQKLQEHSTKSKEVYKSPSEQTFASVKNLEPKNTEKEFCSAVDEERKEVLLTGIKEVLYSTINSIPIELNTCVDATETILNEVYTKLQKVNNFNELRVHDYYTFSHSLNVAMVSAIIGREIGYNENKVKDLTFSAFLHDVGKMKIPKSILYKPGALTEEEMGLVKKHSELGYDYLINVLKLPHLIARPSLQHHERWEGQGYPYGLRGEQISEFSQIIAIADVYDALVSDKVYRSSVQSIEAMRILLTEESRSFNPQILNKFVYLGVVNNGLPILS